MVTITQFAERRGLTKPGTASKIARVIEKNGLPVSCDAPLSEILKAAKNDKKRSAGGITLVLLHDIGEGYLYRVSDSEFNRFFSEVE